MATAVVNRVPVHRLTIDDVHRMVGCGVLDEDDRIELIEGVLVDMVPIGAGHEGAVDWLNRLLTQASGDAWTVRVQHTLLIEGGYFLPDLAVVQPLTRRQQPSTALLVVEVAQTSQVHDHSKAGVYAAADVAEYWIADLAARKLVVHRSPIAGVYEDVVTYADGESVTPLFVDAPSVAVTELLG